MEMISFNWRPHKRSSNALLKLGYSQEQINKTGKIFIERYLGQQLENASTKFTNMVRSSGSGHNIKPKEDDTLEKIQEAKAHKSEDGEQRAQETQQQSTVMSKAEAIAWYDANR